MSNLPQLNRKIKSIRVTSRITYALEILSSTQLNVYRKLQRDSLPYFRGVFQLFYEIYSNPDNDIRTTNKKFISFEAGKNVLWVVVGSDIGMCGDINEKIRKYMLSVFDDKADSLVILGNRLFNVLEKDFSRYVILKEKSEIGLKEAHKSIRRLSQKVFQTFMAGNYQKLVMVYMKDSKDSILEKINILPFTEKYFSNRKDVYVRNLNAKLVYPEAIFDLFPQYLECIILSAILKFKLEEHSIRRDLMHSATKNANELLEEYQWMFKKIRQSNITQEIIEIVVASKFKSEN